MTLVEWAILAALCITVAGVAIAFLSSQQIVTGHKSDLMHDGQAGGPVWLFSGTKLVDASSQACALTGDTRQALSWDQFRKGLVDRFPDLPETPVGVQAKTRLELSPSCEGDPCVLICEWIDGITRVTLNTCNIKAHNWTPSPTLSTAASQEAEALRLAMNEAPYPVWRVSNEGKISWCNAAYEGLCRKVQGKTPPDETPLFQSGQQIPPPSRKTRESISVPDQNHKLWFDVSVVPHDSGSLCYAVDINAVVDAEVAQRNFVQTLAKTFAQLSIGLAIFDRNRQLALFNPALIDLTALPADFLSGRPNLLSFFDRLRDQRMMPEPKNYDSWRHQMADLVEAAADGRYQETWSLPSGSVYSVRGRPHPDGAVAFLIEDITAEITLTRRFRSDLELGQAILDQLDQAIAVFAADGSLTFSNVAYQQLWDVDPDKSFAQMSVLDATRAWQDHCQASPVLGEVRDFVATRENRAEWWAFLPLKTGETLTCNVYPIQSGATMVSFVRPDKGARPASPVRTRQTVGV